jgi:hypothetical protein
LSAAGFGLAQDAQHGHDAMNEASVLKPMKQQQQMQRAKITATAIMMISVSLVSSVLAVMHLQVFALSLRGSMNTVFAFKQQSSFADIHL